MVHSQCYHNAILGLESRMLCITPVEYNVDYTNAIEYFYENTKSKMCFHEPLTAEQFLSKYGGKKFKRYSVGVEKYSYLTNYKKAATCACFVKAQRFPTDDFVAPRVVNFRSPAYCYALGRYTRNIEHALFTTEGLFGVGHTSAKHDNLNQRAYQIRLKWNAIQDPVALSLDCSRFEAHVNVSALCAEHKFYRKFYPRSRDLKRLLKCQLDNIGYMFGQLKYTMEGRRISGDMTTSLGNSLIMMFLLYIFREKTGLMFNIYDDGDDCLVFCKRSEVTAMKKLTDLFMQYGFRLKIENIAYEIEQILFCQARPIYWAEFDGVMCPNYVKHMTQLYVGLGYGKSDRADHVLAVSTATCMLSVFSGVPILEALHEHILSIDYKDKKRVTKMVFQHGDEQYFYAKNRNCKKHACDDAIRTSFMRAYKVEPWQQILIEKSFGAAEETTANIYMDTKKLLTEIQGFAIPFGDSIHGSAFVTKAAHPAHTTIGMVGIPDRTAGPKAMLEFKLTALISKPVTAVSNWGCTMCTYPNAVLPLAYVATPDTGAAVQGTLLNTQIASGTLATIVAAWKGNVQAARVAYQGLTVFCDTPTLSDQGTVVCGQVTPSWSITTATGVDTCTYNGSPITENALMNLPTATQWAAREGVYMPIRLNTPTFPFTNQGQSAIYAGPITGLTTGIVTTNLNAQLGAVVFSNLSINAALRVTMRLGVEVITSSGSAYGPFLVMPQSADQRALDSYFSVAARMNDAYPSSYNDLNKFLGVLKSIGKLVLDNPVSEALCSAIPGVGPAANAVRGTLVRLMKSQSKNEQPMGKNSPNNNTTENQQARLRTAQKIALGRSAAKSAVAIPRRVRSSRASNVK